MQYYLLTGYIIAGSTAFCAPKAGRPTSGGTRGCPVVVLRRGDDALCVLTLKDRKGRLLIRARSAPSACRLAIAVDAYFRLHLDTYRHTHKHLGLLHALVRQPTCGMSLEDLYSIRKPDFHLILYDWIAEIGSGMGVEESAVREMAGSLPLLLDHQNIVEAYQHLSASRQLFDGMVFSRSHLAELEDWESRLSISYRRRARMENRAVYELSFLAAFKALERFCGVNAIKECDLDCIVERISSMYPAITPRLKYSSRFKGPNRSPSFRDLRSALKWLLDIRNTTGAHANKKPPRNRQIDWNSVREIQLFTQHLLDLSLVRPERQ